MKKKVLALVSLLALTISLLPSNAYAYSTTFKGVYVNPSHNGLRAIISTGQGTGSPPAFSFSALNPDTDAQIWDFYLSASYSCLEAGTEFWKHAGNNPTTRMFYVYNICTGQQVYQINLSDSTFRNKYVRQNTWNDTGTAFTDENYELRIVNSSGAWWDAQLYNYNTGAYDLIANVWGSSGNNNGGAFFRDFGATQQASDAYCPTLYPWGIMQFRGMQYRSGSTWTTLGSGDVSYLNDSQLCFNNNTYKATTPNPYKYKILPYAASY